MSQSHNVKAAPWVSIALFLMFMSLADEANSFSIRPNYDCGEYLVHGKLVMTQSGKFVLEVQRNSSSPYELILVIEPSPHLSIENCLEQRNTNIEAKIQVIKPIHDNKNPVVLLKGISEKSTFDGEKQRIRVTACVGSSKK